jgi:mRNA-degrading endonuclease RelE of RelBE toxin-antitoxin system
MTYTVHFSPEANRQIQAVSKRDLPRVISLIISIFQEPRRPGAVLCRKAASHQGHALGDIYLFAIGNYRISYEIVDSTATITIAAIKVIQRRSFFGKVIAGARDRLWMTK